MDNQNNLYNLVKTQLLLSDLKELELQLSDTSKVSFPHLYLLLKNAFLTITHVYDFKANIRLLFRDNPELSELYKKDKKAYKFFKYLRNKLVGHLESPLLEQSIIWEPLHRIMAKNHNVDVIKRGIVYKTFILETLVNTYLIESQEYVKIFGSSEVNFICFENDKLTLIQHTKDTISSVIKTLEKQELILQTLVPTLNDVSDLESYYRIAAKTDFKKL